MAKAQNSLEHGHDQKSGRPGYLTAKPTRAKQEQLQHGIPSAARYTNA